MQKPDLNLILRKLKNQTPMRENNEIFNKKFYVDENIVESMLNPDWQVLFGRRGAGKTTTLKAFRDKVNYEHKKERTIAIFIDMTDCSPTDLGMKIDSESQRLAAASYFQEFIKNICYEIFNTFTKNKNQTYLQSLFNSKNVSQKDVENEILNIISLAETGKFNRVPIDLQSKNEMQKNNDKSISGGLGIGNDNGLINASFDGNFGSRSNSVNFEITNYIFKEADKYRELSNHLSELIDKLNLNRIYLLIDEWTSIDKSGKLDLQPLFAELLGRVFKNNRKICIKFSSIRGTTNFFQLSNVSQIGLEIGDDIFEVADLDQIHSSANNAFFEKLLFKKMIRVDKNSLYFSKVDDNNEYLYEPNDGFIRSFFKTPELFDQIVEASGKIPRKFVEMFNTVSAVFKYKCNEKWDKEKVLNEIMAYSIANRQDIIEQPRLGSVFDYACNICRITGKRIFLIPHNESYMLSDAISNLFHYKLIHSIDYREIPIEISKKYRVYYIDYGSYLFETNNYKDQSYVYKSVSLNELKEFSLESLVIRSADVDLDTIVCTNCGMTLSKSHRAVVKRICYECFESLDLTSHESQEHAP